jgi:hypothetical protein
MTRSKQPSLFPSLLPTDEAAPRKKKEAGRPRAPKIALIDLNLVRPNPAEPRKTLNEEGLRQLADSIRRHGLLNPILVRREQHGTFTTLAGSRRLKACRELRQNTIPALVIDGDPLHLARGAPRLYSRGPLHNASSGGTLRSVSSFAKATEDTLIHPRPHGRGFLRIAEEGKGNLAQPELTKGVYSRKLVRILS